VLKHRFYAVTAALAAAALLPAGAAADTTWTKISSDSASSITYPSIGILGTTAVVTWEQSTGPLTEDLVSDTFQTSPAHDVANGVPSTVAAGWASIGTTAGLAPTPAGSLEIAFGGIHSTSSGDPLIGLIGSTHNADGTWTAPATIATGYGIAASTGALSGSTPFFAGNGSGSISVFVNPSSPTSVRAVDLQAQIGSGDGYAPKLAVDSSGRVWIAWYSSGTVPGIYVQQLDAATGLPVGAPVHAPSSEGIDNNSFGVALACGATCRLVYGNAPTASNTNLLVSWWIGQAAPTTIADMHGSGDTAGRVVDAAYRSDGRLWIAWWNGASYSYVLGDSSGAGGTITDAGLPGPSKSAYALKVAPVGDNLLMAANYGTKTGVNSYAVFVNDVAPPADVTAAPGPRQVNLETTPGGKGFRIQVQYRVPSFCKPGCAAHAELRTRTGARQLYSASATAPLPGDGKLVLGTRPSVKLPGGKKVRFYITISRAELRKAPFKTVGGNRVANTRLRVWLKTKSGQVLTVRDGRIAVSIARIKSGALPGLSGIL
jgi:hypothetical protein